MKDLMLAKPHVIFKMVLDENDRQVEKWGIQDHTPEEWLMYATEELGETAQAIGEFEYRGGLAESVAMEAIQTATLMLKIAEMFTNLLVTREDSTVTAKDGIKYRNIGDYIDSGT